MKNQLCFLLIAAGLAATGNKCFAQANTTLSNLVSPTAVNVNLLPGTTNTRDLGSSANQWRNAYFSGDALINGLTIGKGAGAILSNTAIGTNALFSNTTGSNNTANGYKALYYNTTGSYNTANGYKPLYFNTTGSWNTANGYAALYSNTTGNSNTANGNYALYYNTTGTDNTANGYKALYSNTTGNSNTANGDVALYSNTTGFYNTANGGSALYSNTTGDYNTADGLSTGSYNDNNTYCTFIGYDADQSVLTDFTNSSAFGKASRVTASNQVRIGNSSVTSIGGYTGWSNISDGRYKKQIKENVPGLEFINKLKPVTYNLDVNGISKFLGEDITGEEGKEGFKEMSADAKALIEKGVMEKEQIVYTGFIAQDVETAAKEIGYDFSGVDKPQNESSLYGLRYAEFVVPLVKAVQELDEENGELIMDNGELKTENTNQQNQINDQQNQIDELSIDNGELKSENIDLKSRIEKLESIVTQSSMSDGFAKVGMSDVQTEPLLGQNLPNPFDNSTIIPFRIPKDCHDASIVITESVTGRIVTAIPISCSETHISVEAGNLASGSYSYSLYVDGKMIETRSMVLNK